MSAPADHEAIEPNAYAIAFRLIGDAPRSRSVAVATADFVSSIGGIDNPYWLAETAAEAVRLSLIEPPADGGDVQLRVAVRRRLAAATPEEVAAASLHHLAGYPIADVAAALRLDPAVAAQRALLLSPPAGILVPASRRPEADRRRWPPSDRDTATEQRSRRRRLLRNAAVLLVVLALATMGAALSVGDRPTLTDNTVGCRTLRPTTSTSVPSSDGCSTAPPTGSRHERTTRRRRVRVVPSGNSRPRDRWDRRRLVRSSSPCPGSARPPPASNRPPSSRPRPPNRVSSWRRTTRPPPTSRSTRRRTRPARTTWPACRCSSTTSWPEQCIDRSQVHVAGFGPGARLSTRLACASTGRHRQRGGGRRRIHPGRLHLRPTGVAVPGVGRRRRRPAGGRWVRTGPGGRGAGGRRPTPTSRRGRRVPGRRDGRPGSEPAELAFRGVRRHDRVATGPTPRTARRFVS